MDKLLTVRQLSELLEVRTSTVYEWVQRGRIPYVKLNRLIRFRKPEIFRWVDENTIRPRAASAGKKIIQSIDSQKEFPL